MPSDLETRQPYVLGLDIGSASLGWALVALDESGCPAFLIHAGVRIFEPGVDGTALEIEQGKDQSKAVDRRTARLHRRQLRRRAARQRDLFRLLQKHSLLPASDAETESPEMQRHRILNDLDRQLVHKWALAAPEGNVSQVPLYFLRKRALDEPMEPHELGRVFFHLIQRRGFLSNRREGKKNQDQKKELGKVKAGIHDLEQKIENAGARTIGEYFAGLDPHADKVRRRWTARKMYQHEFDRMWESQSAHHPGVLTEELRREIDRLLFFQRPIAAQSHLIGKCGLEPGQRRAAWAMLEAQRFRILQKVNDLRIIFPGHPLGQPLSPEERASAFDLLDREGDQTFAATRKRLKLGKSEFNLERGDEKKLRGNRTNKAMIAAFGPRWDSFSPEEQKQIVEEWRTSESEPATVRRGMDRWGLDDAEARKWADAKPEDGYCALSRRAIDKLLPLMMTGKSFKEVETAIYGNRFSGGEVLDMLPPLHVHRKIAGSAHGEAQLSHLRLGSIRNPAVERALTELRKVINPIIREYGKPHEVRIELARDLKKPRKERKVLTDKNRQRQKERDKAKADLLRQCGIQNPSRDDIEKALLHAECGGICPYTGKSISLNSLFGEHPQFDVEHIIPLSRYPDNSFQNKTLCWHEENRNIKRNRTPFEAYSADVERWETMQTRIQAWKPGNPGKLKRFMLRSEEELEDFTARQMNDTRYASVLACRLLESLYGGRDVQEPSGTRQVIFASSGNVTATLRRAWGLEQILREALPSSNGQSKGKPRTDHRHHAIDAITIALTRQAVIQSMSRSASGDPRYPRDSRSFRRIELPWCNFVESIRPHIDGMVISHRPEHKMSGALHEETNYGRPHTVNGKTMVHIRKQVTGLSAKDIENIVDPAIRVAVHAKSEQLNGDLSKCESTGDWPMLRSNGGRAIPIKRVRIRKVQEITAIASQQRQRFVSLGNNHHTAIFALVENDREVRWEGLPVSLFEAMERKRKKRPIVDRNHPDGSKWVFKFSLMNGDIVEVCKDGKPELFRLRSIESSGSLFLLSIKDARLLKEIIATGDRWRPSADALRQLSTRKVVVDPLGRVHPAND